jgi:hypothetical protein
MRRPACRVADEIDQKRQAAPVVPCRNVNVDPPSRGITEEVAGEALAIDPEAVYGAFRNSEILAHARAPLMVERSLYGGKADVQSGPSRQLITVSLA